MEGSGRIFSTDLASNQDTICLHNFELEITKEKYTMKGHGAILPGRCPEGITLQSYTEHEGLRSTQFIIHEQNLNREDNRAPGSSSFHSARAAVDSTSPPLINLQKYCQEGANFIQSETKEVTAETNTVTDKELQR